MKYIVAGYGLRTLTKVMIVLNAPFVPFDIFTGHYLRAMIDVVLIAVWGLFLLGLLAVPRAPNR